MATTTRNKSNRTDTPPRDSHGRFKHKSAFSFDRHFEMARNPTLVRVIGRETLETRAGTFRTIVVDMEVKDGRYGSGGTIRLHLSDDVRRLPVRIESSIPMAGRAVLLLTAYTPAPTGVVAQQ